MNGMSGLNQLLEPLDRDQLRGLLLRLAARHPDLADEIATEVAVAQVQATPPAAPVRPPVDVGLLLRQVSVLLDRPYRGYDSYDTSSSIARGMDASVRQPAQLLELGLAADELGVVALRQGFRGQGSGARRSASERHTWRQTVNLV